MSNFRTKLLGIAAVATAFAGMSYGQTIACSAGGPAAGAVGNPTLRAEGATELVMDVVSTCTVTGPAATTGTLYMTTSLPITSKAVALLATGNSEATLAYTVTAPALLATTYVQGAVSGTQVSFPLTIAPTTTAFTLQVQNIRVNATTGGSPQVTESGLMSYAVGASSSNTGIGAANVGYILQSLGATSLTAFGTTSYTTCSGNPGVVGFSAAGTSFTVNIKELVGGAFKLAGSAAAGGEGGSYVSGVNIGTAATATQVAVTYANVPSAATIYVPQTLAATTGATTLTVPNSTAIATGVYAGLLSYTPTNGTVTVTYTTNAIGSVGSQQFNVPTIVQFGANAAAAQGAITASVAYTPTGTVSALSSTIPTFAASTAAAASGSTISLCNTTLLFPFVTNQLGFDTGMVLSNTSTDNLGFAGASVAKPQSGTCTLSFYGAGAPTPATGVADPLGAAGATSPVHAFTVSAVAPGFQGYVIASCPFQYAHGFAFITYNLTQNNGVAEGYIAEVLSNTRPVSVTAFSGVSPTFTAGVLTGLTNTTSTTSISEPTTF